MIKPGDLLLGRYRLTRPLGSGGFGAVYQAEDLRLGNRPVAIKHFYTAHLSPDDAETAAILFQAEAHTLARLNHPNLAQVFDYFHEGHDWFLVMEFVPGETLSALLKRKQAPFDEPSVVRWGIELCRVLEYLHSQTPPIIFRDLKPANIMLTPTEEVILIDFGIARSFKEGKAKDTFQIGTPGYAPPEQYGGQTEPRSDLYSLGVTLHTLLTAERPTGMTFSLPPLQECAPWVSTPLCNLIARATAYDVVDRPASAAAMRKELEAIRDGRPVAAAPAPSHMAQTRAVQPKGIHGPLPASQRFGSSEGRPTTPQQLNPPPPLRPRTPPRQKQNYSGRSWIPLFLVLALLLLGGAGVFAYSTGLLNGGAVAGTTVTPEPSEAASNSSSLVVSTGNGSDRNIGLLDLNGESSSTLVGDAVYDSLADRRFDGKLVFTRSFSGDVEHIVVADADGSNARQLTDGNSVNRAGVWSPDGTTIAFESSRDGGNPKSERDIFLMNADGSNIQKLTREPGWQGGPAWSPDGRQIVYHSSQGQGFQLKVITVATGESRLLVDIPGRSAYWPSWSPDGRTIAFMTEGSGNDQIYTIPATGGTPTQLNLGPGSSRWPRYSPDGRLIAFESNRDFVPGASGPWQVYVYSVADGQYRRVSNGINDDRWPGW